jgi:hypothetical protein
MNMMLKDLLPVTRDSYGAIERQYGAHNYKPFDVVLTRGRGVWVWTSTAGATLIVWRHIQRSIRGIATRASWRH